MIHSRYLFSTFVFLFSFFLSSFAMQKEEAILSDSDLKQIEDVVTYLESDRFKQEMEKLEKEIEEQTSDTALRPIIDPEGHRKDEQLKDNQTLLWEASVPLGHKTNAYGERQKISLPIGLYKGDIYSLLHLSCSWGLEWGVYKVLMGEFVRLQANHIIDNVTHISDFFDMQTVGAMGENDSDQVQENLSEKKEDDFVDLHTLLTRPKGTLWFSKQSMKIWKTVFVYLLASQFLKGMKDYLELNSVMKSYLSMIFQNLNEAAKKDQPFSMPRLPVVALGHGYVSGLLEAFDPSIFTESINKLFRFFELTPEWTDTLTYRTLVQALALTLWLRSCDANLVTNYLIPHIQKNEQEFRRMIDDAHYFSALKLQGKLTNDLAQEYEKTQKALYAFIANGLSPGFRNWVTSKALRVNAWHALANTVIALPAYYKAFRGLKGLYQELAG